MKITVLIENSANNDLLCEWGLSMFVDYKEKRYLIDAGASDKFADNADKLNIDLNTVDTAILSHAHYDHSLGMERFFSINKNAKFILQEGTKENCYGKALFFKKYIGLGRGTLEKFQDRIKFVKGFYQVDEGVFILPHDTKDLEKLAKRAHQYVKLGEKYVLDNYSHEQSVVFEAKKGLVIISSCSHGGVVNIINEVKRAFPEKKIHAIIGGFHLVAQPKRYIQKVAKEIKETGIEMVYTGHCTGKNALAILKEELGDKVIQLESGYEIEI